MSNHIVDCPLLTESYCVLDRQTKGPDDADPVFADTPSLLTDLPPRDDMQTFIFSATLSKDLQLNLKRRYRAASKKTSGKKASALEDLVDRLDFRDPNPEVIDLSPEGGVVAMLKESMVDCVVADKVCTSRLESQVDGRTRICTCTTSFSVIQAALSSSLAPLTVSAALSRCLRSCNSQSTHCTPSSSRNSG